MSKTTHFLLITSWILLSRGYDAYSTYQFTPDLSHEVNPLVSVLGFGWTPLLGIIGILMIATIYAFYISTFKEFDLFPEEKGYSFSEFTTYLYLGKKAHWSVFFYRIPTNLQRFTHYMGRIFTPCLSFAGIVSTLMWLGLKYTNFYPPLHNVTFIYTLLAVGCVVIMLVYSKKWYKIYQSV